MMKRMMGHKTATILLFLMVLCGWCAGGADLLGTGNWLGSDDPTASSISNALNEYYQIKATLNLVPVAYELEEYSCGYPYYIDADNVAYCHFSGTVRRYSVVGETPELLDSIDITDIDASAASATWLCKTSTGYLVATAEAGTTAGKIYYNTAWSDSGWVEKVSVDDDAENDPNAYFWTNSFTYYCDDDEEVVLAGTYYNQGNPSAARSLYASFNGGVTFTRIFTQTLRYTTGNYNCHIHSSAYDSTLGRIWVGYGDQGNRGISYSDDDGSTWTEVTNGNTGTMVHGYDTWQPTGIMAQSSYVSLFTDIDTNYDGVARWTTTGDTLTTPHVDNPIVYSFRIKNTDDDFYYTGGPSVKIDNQLAYAVMIGESSEAIIISTGNGGHDWHHVCTVTEAGYPFEQGMYGPDSNGWVYGAGYRFKVTQWASAFNN